MQPAQPTQPAPTYAAPPATPGDDARGALSPNDEMMQTPRPPKTITGGGPCPYCGGALPDGRRITFCPHCGHNLTVHYCPACSTELEPDWRFCTTCGREQTVGATQ
jgi:Double zinc ribbon